MVQHVGSSSPVVFTYNERKYRTHGGVFIYLKGSLASLINIMPMIGVEKDHDAYIY